MATTYPSKLIKALALFTVLGLGLLGAEKASAADQDFELHNKTGFDIHELYVSPHSSDDWGDDILGKKTLPDGESADITFNAKAKAEFWDLQIVDEDGKKWEWEKLKLTEITDVTLSVKNGKTYAVTKNGDE
ncbi:MAG: argininosuccinate lyase [Chthoniobacterales bacterium]